MFKKTMQTPIGEKEFQFQDVLYDMNTWYHVSFIDEHGLSIEARMYLPDSGIWKFAPQTLPLWVFEMESQLGDAIDHKNA